MRVISLGNCELLQQVRSRLSWCHQGREGTSWHTHRNSHHKWTLRHQTSLGSCGALQTQEKSLPSYWRTTSSSQTDTWLWMVEFSTGPTPPNIKNRNEGKTTCSQQGTCTASHRYRHALSIAEPAHLCPPPPSSQRGCSSEWACPCQTWGELARSSQLLETALVARCNWHPCNAWNWTTWQAASWAVKNQEWKFPAAESWSGSSNAGLS